MSLLPTMNRNDVIAAFKNLGFREQQGVWRPRQNGDHPPPLSIPDSELIDGSELERLIGEADLEVDLFIDAALKGFESRVVPWPNEGGQWELIRTPPEDALEAVGYFNQAILNSGDLFNWLDYAIEYRWAFEAIGAEKWLQTFDEFLPIYRAKPWELTEELYRYSIQTLSQLIENPANRLNRLLLVYIVQHADEIGIDRRASKQRNSS